MFSTCHTKGMTLLPQMNFFMQKCKTRRYKVSSKESSEFSNEIQLQKYDAPKKIKVELNSGSTDIHGLCSNCWPFLIHLIHPNKTRWILSLTLCVKLYRFYFYSYCMRCLRRGLRYLKQTRSQTSKGSIIKWEQRISHNQYRNFSIRNVGS